MSTEFYIIIFLAGIITTAFWKMFDRIDKKLDTIDVKIDGMNKELELAKSELRLQKLKCGMVHKDVKEVAA